MPNHAKDVRYKWKQEATSKPWILPKISKNGPKKSKLSPWSVDKEELVIPEESPDQEEVSKEAMRLLRDISIQKHQTALEVEEVLNQEKPIHQQICAGNYTSVEIHGLYGLIDQDKASVNQGGDRDVIAHMPRWVKGHSLDIRPGDIISVVSLDESNKKLRRLLLVTYTTPDKYYPPGARVSTLRLGVREHVNPV
jgi:hypothetical protein